MKVSEAMVRDVAIAGLDESLSKCLARMAELGVHQLPVVEGRILSGMMFLKDILHYPHDAQGMRAADFSEKVQHLAPDSTTQSAVERLISLGVRALPVVDGGELVGILSETDMIKNVEFLGDMLADRFLGDVYTVSDSDSIGKVMSVMAQRNVSRVPVVDSGGKIAGVVDSLGLIGFWSQPKESIPAGSREPEGHKSAKGFPVREHMRATETIEAKDFSLRDVVDRLQDSEEVVIVRDGLPVGIITPRDVLEMAIVEEAAPVQVARLDKIPAGDRPVADDMMRRFVAKFGKIAAIQRLLLHVDAHSEDGKVKYSLRTRLYTEIGTFMSHAHGWDVSGVLDEALRTLGRRVQDSKERSESVARRPK